MWPGGIPHKEHAMRLSILILFSVLVAGPSSGLDIKHLSMLLNDRKCPDGDFSEGCLRSYNLSMCDLVGADFRGANLRHTNLRGADLRKAVFDGADLTGADLTKARLDPDALAGARLCKTRMPDGQLTGDDCIEGVWHYGEGAEVAAKISPQSRHPEYTITVLRQPNKDLAPPGSVVMRNVKWIGKNTYHAEYQVRINTTVTWVRANAFDLQDGST
jgi:hypothetical protein